VSAVRSLSLVDRPCSCSSLASAKISLADDDDVDQLAAGDVMQQLPDFISDVDDDVARRSHVFPVRPAERPAATGSCPSAAVSPPCDLRTSAEGCRNYNGQE